MAVTEQTSAQVCDDNSKLVVTCGNENNWIKRK